LDASFAEMASAVPFASAITATLTSGGVTETLQVEIGAGADLAAVAEALATATQQTNELLTAKINAGTWTPPLSPLCPYFPLSAPPLILHGYAHKLRSANVTPCALAATLQEVPIVVLLCRPSP